MKFFELTISIILTLITFSAVVMNLDLRFDILVALIILIIRSLLGFISLFYKIKDMDYQRIESNLKGNDFSLATRFYTSIGLLLSLYPLLAMIILLRFSKQDLQIALFGLVIMLIFLLFQFLVVIFTKRLKIAWLEDFERKIIEYGLSDREIRKK